MRTSTRQTVAQSPKIWTNVDRLPKSPSGITETDEAELIFRTPEQGSRIVPPEEKNSGSGGKDTHPLPSQLDHISPAIITLSERQPPAATQLERSGGKGSTPPGTKGPPGGTPFSFERPVDACDLEKRAIFSGGGVFRLSRWQGRARRKGERNNRRNSTSTPDHKTTRKTTNRRNNKEKSKT